MLTTLIQRYRVEPHPKFAGEPFEQLRERYSQAEEMLTLTWVAMGPLHPINGFLIRFPSSGHHIPLSFSRGGSDDREGGADRVALTSIRGLWTLVSRNWVCGNVMIAPL